MATLVPQGSLDALCEALGASVDAARHVAQLCRELFTPTPHLHGLTKTCKPLLELAAAVRAAGSAESSHGEAAGALRKAAPWLTLAQRKIVLGAARPDGVGEPAGESAEAPAHTMSRRMAAVLRLAESLDRTGAHEASVAGALDDGEGIELFISGGASVRQSIADAADGVAAWNATMLRPIRALIVYEGSQPPEGCVVPTDTVARAARRIFQTHWEQFLTRLYGLPHDADIEFVHELRVGLRRLRAALRVFHKALDGMVPQLRDGLKELADALGTVRDDDVFLVYLGRYAATAPDAHAPYLRRLARSERRRRRAHYRTLLEFFSSQRAAAIRDACHPVFTARQDAQGGLCVQAEWANEPLVRHTARILRKRLKKVTKYDRRLERLASERQHALRIECKKLRYTAECLAHVYPGGLGCVIGPMVAMQDALGDVHDADVYRDRILAYHGRSIAAQNDTVSHEAVNALLRHLQQDRDGALAKAAATWKAFTASKALSGVRQAIKATGTR